MSEFVGENGQIGSYPISYPESSGFLVSGWAPVETLGYGTGIQLPQDFCGKTMEVVAGQPIKKFNFFRIPQSLYWRPSADQKARGLWVRDWYLPGRIELPQTCLYRRRRNEEHDDAKRRMTPRRKQNDETKQTTTPRRKQYDESRNLTTRRD